jgi:hypothetical protein
VYEWLNEPPEEGMKKLTLDLTNCYGRVAGCPISRF